MIMRERGERRQLLLASAVEEFATYGYDGASTNRIAERAQVAKGLIFRYFDSKQGLFEAALDHACEHLFAPWSEPLPSDPFKRFEEFLVRRVERMTAYPVHARLVAQFRGEGRRIMSPPVRQLDRAYEKLRADFKQGVEAHLFRADIDPEAALDLLGLAAEGLEKKLLGSLYASAPEQGPETLGASSLNPEEVRERARAVISLLQRGIYRPGASAHGQSVTLDPSAFLATSSLLAPSAEMGDQRRDRILHAAQKLFADRGYDGTSAEAIAEEAGVAKGLVFHHFGSKAELYLAAVADAATRVSKVFFEDGEPPASDLFERLLSWTRRKLLIFQAQPTLYRLVFSAFADPPAPVYEELRQYATEGTMQGWALILEGIDTSPFRPEVQPAQAMELVMMVLDTLSDRGLVLLGSRPQGGIDVLPRLIEDIWVYLELMRDGLCS